jgi:hypothetical protein
MVDAFYDFRQGSSSFAIAYPQIGKSGIWRYGIRLYTDTYVSFKEKKRNPALLLMETATWERHRQHDVTDGRECEGPADGGGCRRAAGDK